MNKIRGNKTKLVFYDEYLFSKFDMFKFKVRMFFKRLFKKGKQL